jgi:glutathione synthase/RimK-type ligase-like ATP-grasp enzyme
MLNYSMKTFDITLLTDRRYHKPVQLNSYVQNILTEDELLKSALESKGLTVNRTFWDNPDYNWQSTDYAIFRTTWDYFDRFDEFNNWLSKTSELTSFINPLELVKWNADKHYLKELSEKGIEIPATIFMDIGDSRSLKELVFKSGWEELILKPAISGAARDTFRFKRSETENFEAIYRNLIHSKSMLLQEFQHGILEKGEASLMLFDGKFSHSILKTAKAGDFRVQDDFGGTVHPYHATLEEITYAEDILSKLDILPVYARVDVIWGHDKQPLLSELELIEPELWLRKNEKAAIDFADAILRYVNRV